jgi:hypothetical protein
VTRNPSDFEAALRDLARQLEGIETRLRRLESASPAGPDPPPPATDRAASSETAIPAAAGAPATPSLALVGRTLVVLGGGFLLRAITEAGVLPRSAGSVAGLAYALTWLLLADRAGRGDRRSAAFHGLAGILIGFPLVWEASRTYGVLGPSAAIAVATALAMAALVVAWRRRLEILAWIVSVALAGTLFSLSWGPGALVPAAFSLVLLGVGTLWIGYIRDWFGLVWFTAFLADVAVLMIALLLLADSESETRFGLEPRLVIAVQVFAVLAYLGSIVARTLFRNRDVILLESLQTAALLLLGLGGAVYVARSGALALTPLGLGCLVLSAGFYGMAFTVLDRRVGGRKNFVYYTTLAIVLALISGALFLERTTLSLVFVALALLTRWFGLRYSRVTLAGHSVFYILAAAVWSGLLASATNALLGSADLGRWIEGPALVVLAAGLAIGGAPVTPHRRTWGALSLVPRILLYVLLVVSLNGIVVALLNPVLPGEGGDPAVTATLRTVVLAGSAFLLAGISRFERSRPAAWLVYPFLVLGGMKLLLDDLRTGRPVTLFVSLAVYGGALILAPRLLRKRPPAGTA